MILYIIYNKSFNDNNFKLWLNHYNNTGLEYKIVINEEDIDFLRFLIQFQFQKL